MPNEMQVNGQIKTRKEVREEKANKDGKGLITPDVKFYGIRTLIALVFEYFRS